MKKAKPIRYNNLKFNEDNETTRLISFIKGLQKEHRLVKKNINRKGRDYSRRTADQLPGTEQFISLTTVHKADPALTLLNNSNLVVHKLNNPF